MGVTVGCCSNVLSEDLDLVISASGDCEVDNNLGFSLSWNGFNWTDGTTNGWLLACDGTTWKLDGPGGEGFVEETPISSTCSPDLELVFEVYCSEECDTLYTVTITESA